MTLARTLVLSSVSGVSFALMGLAYRWGQKKGVTPQVVLWGVALLGSGVFAARGLMSGEFSGLPARVLIWGTVAGLGQYAAIWLLAASLKRGSFGPVWCALMLSFVPVAVYSACFTAEKQTLLQWVSVALAILCVVVASMEHRAPAAGSNDRRGGLMGHAILGVMLLLLMLSGALAVVAIKDLGMAREHGPAMVPAYQDVFLFLMYWMLFLGISAEWVITRKPIPAWRLFGGPTLLAATGSLVAMACLIEAGTAPNVVAFVVSSTLSVLGGFFGAALFFGDKLTRLSWTVIGLGILSVACMAIDGGLLSSLQTASQSPATRASAPTP